MKNIESMIEKLVEKVLNEEIGSKVNEITKSLQEEVDDVISGISEKYKGAFVQPKEMGEEELEEGNEFTMARCKAGLNGDKTFKVGDKEYDLEGWSEEDKKSCKGMNESKKRTLQLTEDEMVELIERIVNEQKIEGTSSEKSAMKISEKETNEYIEAVTKKMKDYLKDGSAGDYEMEPDFFPKGNGEMGDNEKMAYQPSKAVEEYIVNFAYAPGQQNWSYNEIGPDKDWIKMNIEGSSKTGNSAEYANAVETPVGKTISKQGEENLFAAEKERSYNKAKQPVDVAGNSKSEDSLDKIFKKVNSESKDDKKKKVVNEEIERMKNLFTHNYKTQ